MTFARPRLEDLFAPELKPYLTYSLGLHVALAALALRLLGAAGDAGKSTVYTIDFVGGPTSVITSAGPSAASTAPKPRAATPAKPAPSSEFDEFGRRRGHKKFVLPRPSLLRGAQAPEQEEEQPEEPAQTAGPASQGAAPTTAVPGDAGAGVSADMPNFPYPWYITRVRQMLWQQWQARMPSAPGEEAVVVFSLLPNGSVTDLRTETSSGDGAFDLAALAAVQDAAPYPPLPQEFKEPFLKVHVTLRSQ